MEEWVHGVVCLRSIFLMKFWGWRTWTCRVHGFYFEALLENEFVVGKAHYQPQLSFCLGNCKNSWRCPNSFVTLGHTLEHPLLEILERVALSLEWRTNMAGGMNLSSRVSPCEQHLEGKRLRLSKQARGWKGKREQKWCLNGISPDHCFMQIWILIPSLPYWNKFYLPYVTRLGTKYVSLLVIKKKCPRCATGIYTLHFLLEFHTPVYGLSAILVPSSPRIWFPKAAYISHYICQLRENK